MAVEITNEAHKAINKYFSVLKHMGYKPYNQVNKLLILSFIEEFLTGPMAYFITEQDYNDIDKALNCIYGSCMISYPSYKQAFSEPVKNVYKEYRITEDKVLRETEDNYLRVMS